MLLPVFFCHQRPGAAGYLPGMLSQARLEPMLGSCGDVGQLANEIHCFFGHVVVATGEDSADTR